MEFLKTDCSDDFCQRILIEKLLFLKDISSWLFRWEEKFHENGFFYLPPL